MNNVGHHLAYRIEKLWTPCGVSYSVNVSKMFSSKPTLCQGGGPGHLCINNVLLGCSRMRVTIGAADNLLGFSRCICFVSLSFDSRAIENPTLRTYTRSWPANQGHWSTCGAMTITPATPLLLFRQLIPMDPNQSEALDNISESYHYISVRYH